MNDHYSDAFKSIVPEPPSSSGWADGARRKRRNRGRVVAGVAAAAAIALVVPLSLTFGGNATLIATPGKSESPSPHVVGPSPDPATDAPGAAACWEGPGQPRTATAEGAEKGAVRAWLCGDAGNPEWFPGAVGPMEPLVDDVGDIVELLQMWEEFDYEVECTAAGGTDYRIVLDYDDGRRRVVAGVLDDCDTIRDGEQSLPGARELHDRALELWARQRERVDPPDDVVAVSRCRPPSRSVVPDLPPAMRPMLPLAPADAVTGFTCVEDPDAEYQISWSAILEPDLVALVGQSVARGSEEGLARGHLPTWVTITGIWGEALTLQRTQDDGFQWFDGTTPMLWTPPDDILQRLDASAERTLDVESSPSQPALENHDGACMLDADGRMTTTELPADTLPDGPSAVWLCGSMRAPFEPLVGSEASQELVDSFKKLSTTPPTDQRPASVPSYLVVLYPDGQRYVVHVDRESSFEVTWGTAGQNVRYGGREWVLDLEEFWVNQRNDSPLDPPAVPKVGICDNLYRALGRPVDRYDVDGALCTVVATSSGDPLGVELPTPPQLLADVMAGVRNDGFSWPMSDENPLNGWQGDSIVLVDDYGDRQPLLRRTDDTFFWVEGARTMAWKPSPDLAARLAQAFDDGRPSPLPTHS